MEDNFQYYAREKQKKRKKRKENFFQIHHKQTTGGRAIAFFISGSAFSISCSIKHEWAKGVRKFLLYHKIAIPH